MVIYFDNAATSFPKPEVVYRAVDCYVRSSANPGRGSYELALDSARLIFETRLLTAKFLGIAKAEQLVFTGGCTQSINMALKGLAWNAGDVVVVSAMEHNSVMRPLRQLERQAGIKTVCLPYAEQGIVNPDDLCRSFSELHPRLCVVVEASNVTGEIVDLPIIAEICSNYKVPLMIDAAQSAGWTLSKIEELRLSLWCAAGHKGLMGLPGVGLLYVDPQVELAPLISGGTGSQSDMFEMPVSYPDHLEAGTLPGPAIAGLGAGVRWLMETGVDKVRDHELSLVEHFMNWAGNQDKVHVYGPGPETNRTAVIAFNIAGTTPDKVAHMLDCDYGIAVRSGLQCSAQAHRSLGTLDTGVVRVSFGFFNTREEVDELCQALTEIVTG